MADTFFTEDLFFTKNAGRGKVMVCASKTGRCEWSDSVTSGGGGGGGVAVDNIGGDPTAKTGDSITLTAAEIQSSSIVKINNTKNVYFYSSLDSPQYSAPQYTEVTLPSAADIVASYSGAAVGDTWEFTIKNVGSTFEPLASPDNGTWDVSTIKIVLGSGVSQAGGGYSLTVPPLAAVTYSVVITNTGAPAVDLYCQTPVTGEFAFDQTTASGNLDGTVADTHGTIVQIGTYNFGVYTTLTHVESGFVADDQTYTSSYPISNAAFVIMTSAPGKLPSIVGFTQQ